ncbi:TPA: hypothetical protein ACTXE5_004973 [Raoultella ornithinolytica]|uniref:hypothetical protein n=1 Tax=Raoultella ornithinolytica TaxID=54291 RepID=UPI000AAB627F|nr:hypothetical protein [Raoultella ornithinolytica]HDW3836700.1 hypothetical protein [Raoultella ornithinolytica]HEQ3490854.1 hypothetical protein [Raoultella ornithinolytica]
MTSIFFCFIAGQGEPVNGGLCERLLLPERWHVPFTVNPPLFSYPLWGTALRGKRALRGMLHSGFIWRPVLDAHLRSRPFS